ncbi:MAG TPA: hypothetical protein ENJ46_05185 [Hellea balneolensis]|uniref:Uncharacterized protein n=1 Tax=Hellea balneolensis TaxID=287478 RepID=A0A7C3GLQ4_9PROT|nr:hypothetical protein [Hellea balneolensis]
MLFTPRLISLDQEGHVWMLTSVGGETHRERKPIPFGQKILIIPRSQCSFRRADLKEGGRAAVQAARLRAQKDALPGENKLRIVKDDDGKKIGIWGYASPEGFSRTLPESLAYEPAEAGERLVICMEGVEGQVWRDGVLRASRWWPQTPTQRQWQTFMRVAHPGDVTELPVMPAPISVPLRTQFPLLDVDRDQLISFFSPVKLFVASMTIAGFFAAFMGAQYIRYQIDLKATQARIANVSQEASLVLSQRRRARAQIRAARHVDALGAEGRILKGLDGVANALKGQDVFISFIQLRDGVFEVRVKGSPEISGPALVEKLENHPALQDVNVTLGRSNTLIIKAKLLDINASQTQVEAK